MPSSATRTFTDPEMYFAGIRNLQIDGVLTKRGEFRAEFDAYRPAPIVYVPLRREPASDNESSAQWHAGRDCFRDPSWRAVDADQRRRNNGRPNLPKRAGLGMVLSIFRPCRWGSMSLMPEDIAAASKAIIGRELVPASFARSLTPPTAALSRLRTLHEAADHLAKTAPDILAKPEVARAMETASVEAMVFCIAQRHSGDVRNVHRHRARIMRHLEEVLRSTPDKPLYMPQLCATVGASYTTLRDCCQDYLGISPKRYLWLRRMHLAHRALRIADAEKTTVTEIATDHGFWELGRFAVAHRSLFGEMPSAALRRPPEDPTPVEIIEPVWKFVKSGWSGSRL